MQHSLRIAITSADDAVSGHLSGPTQIPVITFGDPYAMAVAELTLNTHILSRSEQAAWLRRLIAAAEDLADTLDVSAPDDVAAGARS